MVEPTPNLGSDPMTQLFDVMMKCMQGILQKCGNNFVSLQTMEFRILNRIMSTMDLSFEDVRELLASHIPIHPEHAQHIKQLCPKYDSAEMILAQDFVATDKLAKLFRLIFKNKHENEAHFLLAMDGLGGQKLGNGPNAYAKNYHDNLRYGTTPGLYDRGNSWKRMHVCATRQVYLTLGKEYGNCHGMYQVMCQVLKEMAGIELLSTDTPVIPEELMDKCVEVYKAHMDDESFQALADTLKSKFTHTENEEGTKRKHKTSHLPKAKFMKPTIPSISIVPADDEPSTSQNSDLKELMMTPISMLVNSIY